MPLASFFGLISVFCRSLPPSEEDCIVSNGGWAPISTRIIPPTGCDEDASDGDVMGELPHVMSSLDGRNNRLFAIRPCGPESFADGCREQD